MQPDATDPSSFAREGKRPRAIELVADDRLSDAEIAKELGINKVTLERWKRHPAFSSAVDAAKTAVADAIRRKGIAVKQNRIDAYVHRWNLLEQIRTERAAEFAEKSPEVAGGGTGLIVRDVKLVKVIEEGGRPSSREYDVYAEDATMLSEFRNIEKQIAQELGEWSEDVNLHGDLTARVEMVGVDPGDI